MLHVVSRPSVLALAMCVLASLLPSSPARAAESCATILTDLRTHYLSTTSQLNAAIAAHADANGKVAAPFILPSMMAFINQTSAASARLQVLLAQGSQATCGATTVNAVVALLVTDLKTAVMGASRASQVVSPAGALLHLNLQLDTQLVVLLRVVDDIYAVSNINSKALTVATLKADASFIASLKTLRFLGVLMYCQT
jgi:hypothetical protein